MYMSQDVTKGMLARTGVYGVALSDGKMLLITQKKGPFAGRRDFPGGGLEFGESPEQALQREFIEEVNMAFDSIQLIDNMTATTDVPSMNGKAACVFYQIGLIYSITGARPLTPKGGGELQYDWIDPSTLSEANCSPLLWKFIKEIA